MYNKFLELLERYLSPIAAKVSANHVLMAIKDAFIKYAFYSSWFIRWTS